jgi:cytochrome c oxidase subunit 2
MNHKSSSRAAHSAVGPMLAVFLVFIILASTWLFTQRQWWLPQLASIHGADIDRVFMVTLIISGVLFILLQGILAYFTFSYGSRRSGRPRYWIRPRLEKRFAVVAGIIIFGVDVTIYALGESRWFKAWGPAPPGTPVIEVMGEQFAWNFRYAGPDNVFGKTDPALISSTNPFGLDKTDPASQDDILSINQLHLPIGKPIRLRIRSHDVIHSFFLPYQRIKQDAVPGMQIELWFVPDRAGEYEIACSQLCGLGHYRMRAQLTVESQEAFDAWLREAGAGQGGV